MGSGHPSSICRPKDQVLNNRLPKACSTCPLNLQMRKPAISLVLNPGSLNICRDSPLFLRWPLGTRHSENRLSLHKGHHEPAIRVQEQGCMQSIAPSTMECCRQEAQLANTSHVLMHLYHSGGPSKIAIPAFARGFALKPIEVRLINFKCTKSCSIDSRLEYPNAECSQRDSCT